MVALNVRQAELVPEATRATVALEGQPPIAGRLTNVKVVLYRLFTFPNTKAQVGRYVDSRLGECYKSLTNVQSPSWSHASLGACAPMDKGP